MRHPNGHGDFHALRSRTGAAEAVLVAFDLADKGDVVLRIEGPAGYISREAIEEARSRRGR